MVLVRCLNKRFLITFGKLHFMQYSATRSKCLSQLHHASHKLQAVDQKGYYKCWSWAKIDMPVDQKEISCWSWTKIDMSVDQTG